MNQVALNNVQLDYLANKHPTLKNCYGGALPCDKLPRWQTRQGKKGFIVNTDPDGEPGKHWIALWTDGEYCELFDSYAIPLKSYETVEPLLQWLRSQYKQCFANSMSVQSLTSQTCGIYALFYLMTKSEGSRIEDFLSMFDEKDLVLNDKTVTDLFSDLIVRDGEWKRVCCKPYRQCNKSVEIR